MQEKKKYKFSQKSTACLFEQLMCEIIFRFFFLYSFFFFWFVSYLHFNENEYLFKPPSSILATSKIHYLTAATEAEIWQTRQKMRSKSNLIIFSLNYTASMLFGFKILRQKLIQRSKVEAVKWRKKKTKNDSIESFNSLNGVNDEPRHREKNWAANGFETFFTINNNTAATFLCHNRQKKKPTTTAIAAAWIRSCKTRKCESVMQNVVNLKSIADEKIIRRFSCWWYFSGLFFFHFSFCACNKQYMKNQLN